MLNYFILLVGSFKNVCDYLYFKTSCVKITNSLIPLFYISCQLGIIVYYISQVVQNVYLMAYTLADKSRATLVIFSIFFMYIKATHISCNMLSEFRYWRKDERLRITVFLVKILFSLLPFYYYIKSYMVCKSHTHPRFPDVFFSLSFLSARSNARIKTPNLNYIIPYQLMTIEFRLKKPAWKYASQNWKKKVNLF